MFHNYTYITYKKHKKWIFLIMLNFINRSVKIFKVTTFKQERNIIEFKLGPNVFKSLYYSSFIIDKKEENRIIINKFINQLNNKAKDILNIDIIPSYQCNLNCSYCYFKFERKYVSRVKYIDVVEWILNLFKKYRYTKLRLGFTGGGEPLLESKFILSLLNKIKKTNINYDTYLITNGTLLDINLFYKLKKYNLKSIWVTVDGPPDIHNRLKNSPIFPSFNRIINNIESIILDRRGKIQLYICSNVNKTNSLYIDELLSILNKKEILYRVKYLIKPLILPDTNSFDYNDVIKAKYFLRKYNILETNFFYADFFCYNLINRNYFAIDIEGNIYKCHAFCGKKEYILANINDNFNKIKKEIDSRKYIKFNQIMSNCLNCNFFPICLGGCKAVQFFRNKRNLNNCTMKRYISKLIDYKFHNFLYKKFNIPFEE